MKNSMKYFAILACLAVVACVGVGVRAQESPSLKAHIPFSFVVGNKTFPAGEYELKRGLDNQPDLLLLEGVENRKDMFFLVHETIAPDYPSESKLVFHRYGERYFLSTIWMEGDRNGRETAESKAEHKLETGGADRDEVSINLTR